MKVTDQRSLRDAFGAFPTGVTVVTCMDKRGLPLGFTANSYTSVSLDPPLVLVCLSNNSRNYDSFVSTSGFAVNILSEDQKDVSNIFAKPVENRFSNVDWQAGPYGSPILDGVTAWFDCSLHQMIESGDHAILIGRVEEYDNALGNALGYVRGSYFTASMANQAVAAAASDGEARISALVEREGEVLLFKNEQGKYLLPECSLADGYDVEHLQSFLMKQTGLNMSVGQTYSVYENRRAGRQHIVYLCHASDGSTNNGRFHSLASINSLVFVDSSIEDILKRYRRESQLGNFSVYFGTEISGTVHKLTDEGN